MDPRIPVACLCLLCASLGFAAGPAERFMQKLALPDKRAAVVAEGDFEARSTGSYGLRIYSTEHAQSDLDTTFFLTGVVRHREGSVEKMLVADLGSGGPPSLVVVIRSAGTGGYLSADAFNIEKNAIVLRASVSGLPADADPVLALKSALQRTKRR